LSKRLLVHGEEMPFLKKNLKKVKRLYNGFGKYIFSLFILLFLAK